MCNFGIAAHISFIMLLKHRNFSSIVFVTILGKFNEHFIVFACINPILEPAIPDIVGLMTIFNVEFINVIEICAGKMKAAEFVFTLKVFFHLHNIITIKYYREFHTA